MKEKTKGITSMTGYGSASSIIKGVRIDVEARSVNARFFDCNCRLPDEYNVLHQPLVDLAQKTLGRGRVDITVRRVADASAGGHGVFHKEAFDFLVSACRQAAARAGIRKASEVDQVLRSALPLFLSRKEVMSLGEATAVGPAELKEVPRLLARVLGRVLKMRRSEGQRLERDIVSRLRTLREIERHVSELSKGASQRVKERLLQRLAQLEAKAELDPVRISQEVLFVADRVDIAEELVRFDSHLDAALATLGMADGGKKLDFLVQEMLRECNTIASKSQDADIQHLMVDAKTEIERVREQAQNLA